VELSTAIILNGPIGSGKTKACLALLEKANVEITPIGGVISPRVFLDGRLIGYDCLDPVSSEAFPLVRLRDDVDTPDWFTFRRLKYAFSSQGFVKANEILARTAGSMDPSMLVFIDEFGRLEEAGLGLYRGFLKVSEALSAGGTAVLTCRDDLVGTVLGLVRGRVKVVHECRPGDLNALWGRIQEAQSAGSEGLK
jgi:nucleoside-triphosphatase THEP1